MLQNTHSSFLHFYPIFFQVLKPGLIVIIIIVTVINNEGSKPYRPTTNPKLRKTVSDGSFHPNAV